MHAAGPAQETADSQGNCKNRSPIGYIVHFAPAQYSVNGPRPKTPPLPTAMQSLTVRQATLLKAPPTGPLKPMGGSTGSTCQDVPFHRSADGSSDTLPATRQLPASGQDTPVMLSIAVALGSSVQAVPFQDSASGARSASSWPTATQLVALAQDTAEKALDAVPGGAAVASSLQVAPFHSSAVAPYAAKVVGPWPTATQESGVTQEIPDSMTPGASLSGNSRHREPFHASANCCG